MVTVVAVVLVLPSVVDDDSFEVEPVSEVELTDLAQEFIFRIKKKLNKISMNKNFRLEIFFNEKEMRQLNNPNAVNKISNFGIMDRSLEICW